MNNHGTEPDDLIEILRFERSEQLVKAIQKNEYTCLISCEREDDIDFIKLQIEVELPQRPPVPINQIEDILIVIKNENDLPNVFAIRDDFPETIHQNASVCSHAWLCLYEDPWIEISDGITPEMFIERIREWLERAAINELHLQDQPLEPYLITGEKIIIDEEFLHNGVPEGSVLLGALTGNLPQIVSVPIAEFEKIKKVTKQDEGRADYLGFVIKGKPTYTRIISRFPNNLFLLMRTLEKIDINLTKELINFIQNLNKQFTSISQFENYRIAIFLTLPKCRAEGEEPENNEYWVFIIDSPIKELGKTFGILDSLDGTPGVLIEEQGKQAINEDFLKSTQVFAIAPIFTLNKALARKSSGIANEKVSSKVLGVIGLGALGSQVIMNLCRQGIGNWIFIDNDLLLPHNLARHSLPGRYIGFPKVIALHDYIESMFNNEKYINSFNLDYLQVNNSSEGEIHKKCHSALMSSNILLDFSASKAVSQKLALDGFPAPCLSAYLVPSGNYCVALYEGEDRAIRLDDLEQQLMAFISEQTELCDFWKTDKKLLQVAGSCRDLSMVISNDLFLGYSGILSRFIKDILINKEPRISIFKWSENPQSISEIPVPINRFHVSQSSGWEIRTSDLVLSELKKERRKKLPNETGGVLLGKINHGKRIIHVSRFLPSPPDSIEWPMAYIRGVQGLRQRVDKINEITQNGLNYIGEWHSHPDNTSINPSKADLIALDWVAEIMSSIGYPGLMAIIGKDNEPNYLLMEK